MKGFIFNTPFYTKIDWHTGKLILSKNGQIKGDGEPGSAMYQARAAFRREAVKMYDNPQARAHVTYNGKKMIMLNLMIGEALAHSDYGGERNKQLARELKHRAAIAKERGAIGTSFQAGMNPNLGMSGFR